MKVGDLVIMPKRQKKFGIEEIGIVVDSKIVRNRIPVLWSDGNMHMDYEPIQFLEIINESR